MPRHRHQVNTQVGDYRVMVSSTSPLPDGGRVAYPNLVTRRLYNPATCWPPAATTQHPGGLRRFQRRVFWNDMESPVRRTKWKEADLRPYEGRLPRPPISRGEKGVLERHGEPC